MGKTPYLPRRIKIYAVVCSALFAILAVLAILRIPVYNAMLGRYNVIKKQEEELQGIIDGKNREYYVNMLENGIMKITDGQGNELGYNAVYSVIKEKYSYRLYINDSFVNASSGIYQLNSKKCIIRFEEYFEKSVLEKFPIEIMYHFSYFRTLGKGGENADIKQIVTYTEIGANFSSVTAERKEETYKTVIYITYEDIKSGFDADIEVGNKYIADKLGFSILKRLNIIYAG